MLLGAPDGPMDSFIKRAKKWLESDYHQPADEVPRTGIGTDRAPLAIVGLIVGMRIANSDAMPRWLRTSPFNQPRGTNKPPPQFYDGETWLVTLELR